MNPSIKQITKISEHTQVIEIEVLRLIKQQPEQYHGGLINAICTLRKEIEQIEKPLKIKRKRHKNQTTKQIANI